MGNQQCIQPASQKRTRIWYTKQAQQVKYVQQVKQSQTIIQPNLNAHLEIKKQGIFFDRGQSVENIVSIEKLTEQTCKIVFNDGTLYIGQCKDSLPHGNGNQTRLDGSKYIGSYYMGIKSGKGKYIWPDESYYNGDWRDNQIQGQGTWVQSNGWSYTGSWVNCQMHGFGKYTWEYGRCYEGQYVCNYKQGFGKYYWPNGNTYEGFWKRGKRHGRGIMVINGQKRQGIWKNDQIIRWLQENKIVRKLQKYENPQPIIY